MVFKPEAQGVLTRIPKNRMHGEDDGRGVQLCNSLKPSAISHVSTLLAQFWTAQPIEQGVQGPRISSSCTHLGVQTSCKTVSSLSSLKHANSLVKSLL